MFDKVVSALIESEKIDQFFRIKEAWLIDDEIDTYHFIRNYIIDHEVLPNASVLTSRFHKTYPVPHGRLGYEINALKDRHTYVTLVDELPKFAKALKKNPADAIIQIKGKLNDLETVDDAKVIPLNKAAAKRFERYTEKVGKGGVTYLSMGHAILDDVFYGLTKTDLVTIGGRAGLGKTWFIVILSLLIEKVIPEEYGPILFVSNEMGTDEIEDRFDCARFFLDYEKFLKGELPRDQRNRLRKGLKELEHVDSKIVLVESCYNLDDLHRLLILYKPCMYFIDGTYLMHGEGKDDWNKITFITRGLKRISKALKIPGVGTTQLRKGTGTKKSKSSFDAQDEFAFSSSYTQDSDIALAGFQTPQMLYNKQIGFNIAKGRRVKPGTTLIWHHDLTKMTDDFTIDGDGDEGKMLLDSDANINI